jgi:hypothetical protein
MPGFVDVTGWTSEQVRRLGHEDDSDQVPAQPRWRSQRSAAPAQVGYLITDVWAAACHAQRINGAYVKQDEWELPSESATAVQLKCKSNRNVMMEALHNTFMITDEDRDAGEQCRKFIQNDLTFRALKNQLTDFDRNVMKITAVTDKFYTVTHRLELATVACLPQSHQRALQRQAQQDRLNQTTATYIGAVGDKVTVDVEVVRCNFSQKWNIWYVTAITSRNEQVFFAVREERAAGTHITIRGTVKAHRDGSTQLNRVSVQ